MKYESKLIRFHKGDIAKGHKLARLRGYGTLTEYVRSLLHWHIGKYEAQKSNNKQNKIKS